MKPATHFLKLLAIAAWPVGGLFSAPAHAGPATYDKDSKSFHLTYTFANLAGAGIGDQVVGAAYKPAPDEEALVKSLAGLVSDVLFKATEGRAKIGQLDYVDDIKNADIVVSKTGTPASGGWANRGAIDHRPGYLVLYYQTLLPCIKQDVVYTGAHEFCHYAFNLVDEYTPNASSPCPNRSGPGCLMDNYYSSVRGYMGRFCNDSEHTSSADQPQSCQSIVNKFFTDRGVQPDPTAVAGSGANGIDPRQSMIETTIGKVKAKHLEDIAKKKPGSSSGTSTGGLRTFAKNFLNDLVSDFNRNNPNKSNQAIFTPSQISQAIDMIVRVGTVLPALKPAGLGVALFEQIKAEAIRLGQEVASVKSESSRVSKIKSQLQGFVAQMKKNNLFDKDDFPKDQQKDLIERLAKAEGQSQKDKDMDRLLGISDVNVQMTREIAVNIVDILDAVDAPGIPARRAVLRQFDEELKKFSIPGRTAARFGRRRTRFINPDPYDPAGTGKYDYVVTQGGVFPYISARDRGFSDFARLIDRARIELVEPRFSAESLLGGEPIAVRIDRPFEAAASSNTPRIKAQRNTNFQALLADLYDQIQRDRLENVAVLVPPGNLPLGIEQSLDVLRAKLQGVDVRLDLVLVGPATIPPTLRDLSVRSGGSILTITDIDEIGAIAQRLKNEETSGAWIVVPQQGTISPDPSPLPTDPDKPREEIKKLIKKADSLSARIEFLLQFALDSLNEGALKVDLNPAKATPDVIARANEAKIVIKQMITFLDMLVHDTDPSSDLGVDDRGGPFQEPNTRLGKHIVFLKQQIEAAKKLIELSKKLPLSNVKLPLSNVESDKEQVKNLIDLLNSNLASDKNRIETAKKLCDLVMNLPLSKSNVESDKQHVKAVKNLIDLLRKPNLADDEKQIEAAKKQIDLVKKLPLSNVESDKEQVKNLIDLLNSNLASDKNRIETAKKQIKELLQPNLESDPSAQLSLLIFLLERDEILGKDLVELDKLARGYEKILDVALTLSKDYVPIFERIDRTQLDVARKRLEAAFINPNKPSPIDQMESRPYAIRLARFYVEKDAVSREKDAVVSPGAGLELIVGLSRPLPKLEPPATRPVLEIYNDAGALVDLMQKVVFDESKSSETLLVYRVEFPRVLPEDGYTPFLILDQRVPKVLENNDLNFTFSAGSTRHNVQLLASVIDDVTDNSRGTLHSSDRDAVIEVHVSAGSAILDAKVVGFYQKITQGSDPIIVQTVEFQDKGQPVRPALGDQPEIRDKQKDDGIYTAAIPINDVHVGTEFRVFIQADTTDGLAKAKYIPLDDPNRGNPAKNDPSLGQDAKKTDEVQKSQDTIEGTALKFQRATSIHFRVEP